MRIAVLQHAAHEGPGEIAEWAKQHGHEILTCHLYDGEGMSGAKDCDLLVVMGGEMNIYQYRDYKWLSVESKIIKQAMERGRRVVGICLGAQLIADALGSRVHQNQFHEIGWLPVGWTPDASKVFSELKGAATVLHWHGDTFETPADAIRLGASEGCANQGFVIPKKCLALQFHLETDVSLVRQFVESQPDWPEGPYVQSPDFILKKAGEYCDRNRQLLHGILDRFVG